MESYSQKTEKIMKVFSRFSDNCIIDLQPFEYNKAYTYIAKCLLEFELEKLDADQPRDRNAELEAEIARLRKALEELIKAMNDYEMEVDEPAPYKHREMMKRAKAALEARDG